MSAYTRIFAPRGGWFGAQLVNTSCVIGTGGVSIVDTSTTSYIVPVPGYISNFSTKGEALLVALNFSISVAAVSASGTVLLQAFKRNNQGTPADVTLTATKSIETDVVTTTQWTYAWPLTAQDTIFYTTDMLRVDAVTTNTVGTQPTMKVSALWAVRRVG